MQTKGIKKSPLRDIATKFARIAAIAGMSIVTRFCFFIFAIIIGLGQGFQPLCGFCYGARLYGRVREGFLYCIKIGTCFLVLCAVLGAVFAHPIVALFRDDPDVVAVGVAALRWQMLTFVLLPRESEGVPPNIISFT